MGQSSFSPVSHCWVKIAMSVKSTKQSSLRSAIGHGRNVYAAPLRSSSESAPTIILPLLTETDIPKES